MYKDKRILALIPARGGSKGIKDKNIIDLCGKPLIAYSIECGLQSKYVDSVVVTTDSERIAEVARRFGARIPFMRPAALAEDRSTTLEAVLHAIGALADLGEHYDTLVLLQPTQPLRTAEDVDGAIELFFEKGMRGLTSVSEVKDHPLLVRTVEPDGTMRPMLKQPSTCRRQDMPPYYRVNGCVYINNLAVFDENTSFNDNVIPYIMPRERSVDIDDLADLVLASYYLSEMKDREE